MALHTTAPVPDPTVKIGYQPYLQMRFDEGKVALETTIL
jgi:hypothetical protein